MVRGSETAAVARSDAMRPPPSRRWPELVSPGQMHGATLLGADDRPLRPAILWNDGRSFAECLELKRRVPDVEKRTGNLVMPGFHRAEDAVGRRARAGHRQSHEGACSYPRTMCACASRARLCRTCRTRPARPGSMSRAGAGTRTLLAATGLSLAGHAGARRGVGGLGASLAGDRRRLGASTGASIPIAGGGGDNAASAIGVGATSPGAGFVSLGTSGVVFSVTDRYVSLPERTLHAFCHALPHRWHGMSVMLSAASALSWLAGVLGRENHIGELVAGAEAFARSRSAVASAPVFLPYLSGERTPYNDAEATGMFAGLRASHGADALVFAVMEGVAFSFADGVDVLDAAGARPVRPLLVGGGARSEFWGQMIADVTGLTIDLAEGAEAGAALGAARLGMLAAGRRQRRSRLHPPAD